MEFVSVLTGGGFAVVVALALLKIVANHLHHNTTALVELTEAVRDLRRWMQHHEMVP